MNDNTVIHSIINQRGDAWIDYFSVSTEPIDEFHDHYIPGTTHDQNRIRQELKGAKGISRELNPRKNILPHRTL